MTSWAKKKYFKLAKGFYGRAKNCIRVAVKRVQKSLQHAYIGRKLYHRQNRRNWIHSINSVLKQHQISYNQFIYNYNKTNITLNRKILAELCKYEPYSFKSVVDQVKIQRNIIPKQRVSIYDAYLRGLLIDTKPRKQDYQKKDLPLKVFYQDET